MSELFDLVSNRFAQGHSQAAQNLWVDPRLTGDETFAPAAVLVAMTERKRPGILLLHRPTHMRSHPGQVAFPGGRLDPGETSIEAALREANEELGIDVNAVRVVGSSDLYRSGSGFEITPVIGIVPPDIEIVPNPDEVAQWFEAPADFILDPANHLLQTMEWEGSWHTFVEIQWREHRIWGVTAAIISNLAKRLAWHG